MQNECSNARQKWLWWIVWEHPHSVSIGWDTYLQMTCTPLLQILDWFQMTKANFQTEPLAKHHNHVVNITWYKPSTIPIKFFAQLSWSSSSYWDSGISSMTIYSDVQKKYFKILNNVTHRGQPKVQSSGMGKSRFMTKVSTDQSFFILLYWILNARLSLDITGSPAIIHWLTGYWVV